MVKQDYEGAKIVFTKAIELEPKSASAYFFRAGAKLGSMDRAGKLKDYDKAIELDPTNALYYLSRGLYYYDNFEKRCIDLKKASELGNDTATKLLKSMCK